MGGQPSCYMSDQSPGIVAAIKDLKDEGLFTGEHFLDGWHLLNNVKIKNKDVKRELVKLLKVHTTNEYNDLLKILEGDLENGALS